jgi:hypothetical protein
MMLGGQGGEIMTTRVDYFDSPYREKRTQRTSLLEKASQEASQRIKRYCLGRLARDLEVRNCLKNIENNTEHPRAAACAAEVSMQLERLDE